MAGKDAASQEPDPDQVRKRIQALVFGINDMASVYTTAEYLLDVGPFELDLRVERTIQAGLVITYARPFITSKGLPSLSPATFDTQHLTSMHQEILEQRKRVYAHTDDTNYRIVIGSMGPDWLEEFVATGGKALAETWSPPTPNILEDFRGLAHANRNKFMADVEKLHRRLGGGGNDPTVGRR